MNDLVKVINTTPEVVFKEVNIYRTTTVCKKNSRGIWYFEGKIFYQSANIRAQIFVSGSNNDDLIKNMKREMARLKGWIKDKLGSGLFYYPTPLTKTNLTPPLLCYYVNL